MIGRFLRRLVAPLALVPILHLALPTPRARADEAPLLILGGEIAVLGASIGTTIAVSFTQPPPIGLAIAHFTLAAANIGIGAVIIGLGLSIEGGGGSSLGGAIRTFAITFGVLQALNGVLMAVLGGFALAVDDDDGGTTAMLVPLTLRLP